MGELTATELAAKRAPPRLPRPAPGLAPRHAPARASSLTARLLLLIALVLAGGAVVIGLAAFAYGRQAADEAYDRLLAGAALQISERILVTDGQLLVDLPISAFELLALARRDKVFYRIIAPSGETVTGYDELAPPLRGREDGETHFFAATVAGADVRAIALTRLLSERNLKGAMQVVVAQTTEARRALASDITQKALLMLLLAGALTSGLVFLAIRLSLRPLHRIELELMRRDPKDLSPLAVVPPREVDALVTAINRFMERLNRRVEMMQNLVADAAHQLRTPLAAIRAQAEVASEEQDPEELRATARRIHRRSIGISRLADQLLTQALVAHRGEAVSLVPLDLRIIAAKVQRELGHDLAAARSALSLNCPETPVVVLGDEISLVEAVKNLASNAFRHGAPPVLIEVVEDIGAQIGRITVADCGAGIAVEQWAAAGTRFARFGKADADGAGLGLAIARAVAEAHDAELNFSSLASGGFAVSICFPQSAMPLSVASPASAATSPERADSATDDRVGRQT